MPQCSFLIIKSTFPVRRNLPQFAIFCTMGFGILQSILLVQGAGRWSTLIKQCFFLSQVIAKEKFQKTVVCLRATSTSCIYIRTVSDGSFHLWATLATFFFLLLGGKRDMSQVIYFDAINHSNGRYLPPCRISVTSVAMHRMVELSVVLKAPSLIVEVEKDIFWRQFPSSSARTRLKFLGSTIAMFITVLCLFQAELFISRMYVYV